MQRGAAAVFEPPERAGLPSSEPLAHRLDGRAELAGGRLDAVLSGEAHQLEAQVRGVCRAAQHGVISQRTHRSTGLLRSEEHTSELQSRQYLVCRLLLEKKK